MKLPFWAVNLLLRAVDRFHKHIKRSRPAFQRIDRCKIISHRGEYDNRRVFENTLAAFDRARDCGVWGIEFDIRWTRDLIPIVIHDSNTRRLFRIGIDIGDVTFSRLNAALPVIPSLEYVIGRYGGDLHLMVEIKEELYPDPAFQKRVLKAHFERLRPAADYHLISLSPRMLDLIDFLPSAALLGVAETNVVQMSELAIARNYGGLLGHYALVSRSILAKHRAAGQKVGTGYIGSQNCLFRELNRQVEWLFSNNGCLMQTRVLAALKEANAPQV